MNEAEKNKNNAAAQKARIRERYKGVAPDRLEIIPARPQTDFYDDEHEKRVAVYARVSTDDPRQTSSYELQKNYYTDFVKQHPNWTLIDIYADEGISGTSLRHRDSFNQMIADCYAGKIDLVVTKSVSRFARNLVDCIDHVRKLKALNPPIGVFFETERIYTLNSDSEMSLAFIATMAQEESHTKSAIMNASIEMRFAHGIFLTPPLLGYDNDEEGNLVVNLEEAKTVRLIFFMYLYGYTCRQIADLLTSLQRKTKKGNTQWSPTSILGILQNERHCGDILSRKTFTPNYLDHKSKKNRGDRNQYRQQGHHEAIISVDDFVAVQRLISNAKYGTKGILPELHVITNGLLKGYVRIHPRWASFHANDYRRACASVCTENDEMDGDISIEANEGDLDLRGFEIARTQFFDTTRKISLTFTTESLVFSSEAIAKLSGAEEIELLIHPFQRKLVVRKCPKESRTKLTWGRKRDGTLIPKRISGKAFLGTMYELLEWDPDYKYRVRGIRRQNEDTPFLLFDLSETEIFMPGQDIFTDNAVQPVSQSTRSTVIAYPALWADSFGMEYYRHAQIEEMLQLLQNPVDFSSEESEAFQSENSLNTTGRDQIEQSIDSMILEFSQEAETNGLSEQS